MKSVMIKLLFYCGGFLVGYMVTETRYSNLECFDQSNPKEKCIEIKGGDTVIIGCAKEK